MLSPILVIMMVGMVDFGRVFYSGIAISHAARAGAQYGIISQTNAENGNGIVQAALNDLEDVQGVAVTTETYCACASGAVVSCDTRCGTKEGSPRVYVRVVAQKTFQTIIDYPGIPHSVNIQREAVMRVR